MRVTPPTEIVCSETPRGGFATRSRHPSEAVPIAGRGVDAITGNGVLTAGVTRRAGRRRTGVRRRCRSRERSCERAVLVRREDDDDRRGCHAYADVTDSTRASIQRARRNMK